MNRYFNTAICMAIVHDGDEPIAEAIPDAEPSSKCPPEGVQTNKSEVIRYAQNIPSKYQQVYLRAATGKSSPREAIKAKCLDCVGYEEPSNRIRACSAKTCPVWQFRPYQKK